MRILAIETSCDETAAAVVEDLPAGRQVELKILSNVVASSSAMHEKYGGIVPEVAAREQLRCIIPVITEALALLSQTNKIMSSPHYPINSTLLCRSVELNSQWIRQTILRSIDAIAVTVGPGLIGSLLVGVETAKTIAFATSKSIIPVNHVIAHMYANFITQNSNVKGQNGNIKYPAISLVVSGGHTELYLMKSIKDLTWLGGTIDDAAGECFDKTARILGLGHGGGPAIQNAAKKFQHGNTVKLKHLTLPRPMIDDETLNFSFSGLKTAVVREVNKAKAMKQWNNETIGRFAYEIQEAITDVLVEKTLRAAKQYDVKSILLSGGVAANSRLREKFSVYRLPFTVVAPEVRLCTDNAVMIAAAAYFLGCSADWHKISAQPDLSVEV